MRNNTVFILTALVLVAIAALMAINFAPNLAYQISTPAIPTMQIKGIDLIEKGTSYTLNFEQQKVVAEAIQKAVEVKKSDYPTIKGPFNFDKIVIHRFNASALEIIPIEFAENNLVFSAPVLNKDVYYMELSGGALQNILKSPRD